MSLASNQREASDNIPIMLEDGGCDSRIERAPIVTLMVYSILISMARSSDRHVQAPRYQWHSLHAKICMNYSATTHHTHCQVASIQLGQEQGSIRTEGDHSSGRLRQ